MAGHVPLEVLLRLVLRILLELVGDVLVDGFAAALGTKS